MQAVQNPHIRLEVTTKADSAASMSQTSAKLWVSLAFRKQRKEVDHVHQGMTRTASATKLASAATSIRTNGTRFTAEEPNGPILSPTARRLRPDDARVSAMLSLYIDSSFGGSQEILKDILKEKKSQQHATAV